MSDDSTYRISLEAFVQGDPKDAAARFVNLGLQAKVTTNRRVALLTETTARDRLEAARMAHRWAHQQAASASVELIDEGSQARFVAPGERIIVLSGMNWWIS